MHAHSNTLCDDAVSIWRAGLSAVDSERLIAAAVQVDGDCLLVGGERYDLSRIRRIAVVGAGKAGAGMAAGLEQVLGPRLIAEKQLTGWVNVPADCVRPLSAIRLHAARAPGQNEPTPEGAAGAAEILKIVGSLTPDDLCFALISGGGSALMPAPVEGITLEDKLAVTRHLSGAGADIRQLNTVRKQLSRIKGGGLRRACRAGRLVTLIISDVLGDPLDVIASGPTVDDPATPADALAVLEHFGAAEAEIAPAVFDYLRSAASAATSCRGQARRADASDRPAAGCLSTNLVIGNNATAVEAAAAEAARLGYATHILPTDPREGFAEDVGRALASQLASLRNDPAPQCIVGGGEPVVHLIDASSRGRGGRNQQLVLAAAVELMGQPTGGAQEPAGGFALLSGGTDGEDGPTDAAGAVIDGTILSAARRRGLDPADFLRRNDAYHFFAPLDALIMTGPTHTNVCDVRVVLSEKDRS